MNSKYGEAIKAIPWRLRAGMKLQIGKRIRELRRERNITQEKLAELLGVSFQSVSRWESGVCYPDMELLPVMGSIFDVTVDYLLGVDQYWEQKKVEDYLAQFQTAVSAGDIDACIQIARAGVKEFPNQYTLLNKLMYALFLAGDEDGNIPDWEENKKKYDGEITKLGERIRDHCPNQEIRLEAVARLAFHHCDNGRREQGRALYESLPSRRWCRENAIWWALEEEEKLPFTRQSIRTAYADLASNLFTLVSERLLPDEELICVFEKWKELNRLIFDDPAQMNGWSVPYMACQAAGLYARTGRPDAALEKLEEAARGACAFDERPEEWKVKSLLLGVCTDRRQDFETTDSRPLCEVMRDKWMAHTDFDTIRDMGAFRRIKEMLSGRREWKEMLFSAD